jgi:hypothetical protein
VEDLLVGAAIRGGLVEEHRAEVRHKVDGARPGGAATPRRGALRPQRHDSLLRLIQTNRHCVKEKGERGGGAVLEE